MIFDPILDLFRGKAITIPPLDGAFLANAALDEAPVVTELTVADNLCVAAGTVYASSGPGLYRLDDGGERERVEGFAEPITALAASADGTLAVALDDGTLIEGGVQVPLPKGISCITALAYGEDGSLWLANGSGQHPPSAWVADLMEKNASGSVWRRKAGGAFERMARGLAWPYGVLPRSGDMAIVSESWRHRLVRVDAGGADPVLKHLPGYPARLAPAADGGVLLSIFAPRNRLIELVLQEKHYRYDMMLEVPREYWIAPTLSSGRSFLEPLQCGGIRTMGVHKAWAPSRSYGMVVRLDEHLAPVASLHSRANGQRHGTTSAIEADGRLLVASKGGNCILAPEGL
ncbi:SMP-30/gluconolactonase/LRE family protein [Rhodobium gokarnense]|uniref:Strictosidine synthase conserved region domain-containing protein n=1 Tax=Rhodobium gokarnense TaxID=364296 RepID=A0ABT3H629_9HYPH|nr:hypothetical protein [Rhodobium gokarnense]MCW2305839.1 hypothetical protein [Rhodobium gokarnense]